MAARNLHVISVPRIKCLSIQTGDPIFPALEVYFKNYNLTFPNPIMPMSSSSSTGATTSIFECFAPPQHTISIYCDPGCS
jgi:hypothetical protein